MISRIRILLALTFVCLCAGVTGVRPLAGAEMGFVGGMPAVLIDGEPEVPLIFYGNTQFGTDYNAWAEIEKAAQAGFHLHKIVAAPPWWENPNSVDTKCNAVLNADPSAHMIIGVSLFPTWNWLADHLASEYRYADGTTEPGLPVASVTSLEWRQDAGEQLRSFVRHALAQGYGDRIVGVSLDYMTTGEWFYIGTNEQKYADYSPVNLAAFRAWLRERYRTDAALQAAWHDGGASLAAAQIPTPAERDATSAADLRDPSTSDQKTIDYYRFMAQAMIDAQEHFRQIVEQETNGEWLILHYFGYTYELADPPHRPNYSGQMAYARRSLGHPTLHGACGPYSYFDRGPGEPGHSHSTQHSWALYNQLYWHEDDSPMHDGGVTPANLPTMIELALRNGARQIVYGGGLWWMDWKCEGWWDYQEFWDAMGPLREAYADYLARGDRSLDPEFVIVADPEVFVYQNDLTGLTPDAMGWQRRYFGELGAQIGYFTARDLREAVFPHEHAKLYYFINPYFVDEEYGTWIDENLKRDGNVLVWLYAPGLITSDGLSDQSMSDLTGIALRHSLDPLSLRTTVTNGDGAPTAGLAGFQFGPLDAHSPVVYADPGQVGVTTLGVYVDDASKIAYCMKDCGSWTSVFVGAGGQLYVPVLRGLADLAGVHLYTPASAWPAREDGIVGSKDFLALHAAGDGVRTLNFPQQQAEITDALTGSVLATDTSTLELPVAFGSTYLLGLSPRLAAELVQADIPSEVQVGSTFDVSLEYANRGADSWSGADGFALLSQAPIGNGVWGVSRVDLGSTETVSPGASRVFTLSLTAPDSPGTYACRWRMSETGGRGGFGVPAHTEVGVYTFPDVRPSHWAWAHVEACVGTGIVGGYVDGTYQPGNAVTRDQMAVYIARALVAPSGEAALEDYVPADPRNFSDAPPTGYGDDGTEPYWAYKHIEYCVENGVVAGYEDGTYHPEYEVTRAQMAVYVARSLVAPSGEAGLADYVPDDPRNFPDVPDTGYGDDGAEPYWAYTHIEYCVEHGVVQGYLDGLYHPDEVVTRAQMAVYVARAFGLVG